MTDDINPKDALGAAKPDLSLIPPAALIYITKAMEEGAAKYGPYNWREKKVRARVYVAAALRHILEYLDGEDNARDYPKPHLGGAMASLAILADAIETGNLIDDRPPQGAASRLLEPAPAIEQLRRNCIPGLPPISSEQDGVEKSMARARAAFFEWCKDKK